MRSGNIQDVAMVLKGLAYLSQRKALSFREKKMLDRARFLVVSEIAEVEGVSAQSVEEQVDRALNRAFAPEGAEGAADRQKPVGNPRPSNA
jgi:CarD family transcriptional regulator